MRLALSLAFASFLALHTHTAQAIETTMDIDWSATGVTPVQNARMGQSVADAGDVNGDGYGDVVVGAYEAGGPTGRAYVFYGSASGLSATPDRDLQPIPGQSGYFGRSVSGAGDVNGDGYDDVIVGSPNHTNPTSTEGAAMVYLGSESGLSETHAWIVEGEALSRQLGYSVAGAGDVNADGYDDVIVGAWQYTNGEASEGAAYVFLGSESGLSTSPQVIIEGDVAGERCGHSVAGAGDVNGDGYDDVLMGCPNQAGTTWRGRAILYPGSASGVLTTPLYDFETDDDGGRLGFSVSGVGDLNADGYDDIAAGARHSDSPDNAATNEGEVFVVLGAADMSSPVVQELWIDQSASDFGFSVSGGGDFNRDGYADLLVGAQSYDAGSGNNGGALLYLGSRGGIITEPATIIYPEDTAGDLDFGTSLALVGSVNGDGWDDLIIGDPLADPDAQNSAGMAHGIYGREIALNPGFEWWDTNPDEQPNDQLGFSVADAGDVNADGYGDVIVGQPYYDNEVGNEGAAYLYLGSPDGLPDFDGLPIERDNNISTAYFGYAVAGAGDVNQDGFDDVLIGAPRQQEGATPGGAVYVYTGSDTGLSTSEFHVFEGDESGAMYGSSVDAGDFNGDGIRDVVIGAHFTDDPEINEGAVFVYYGSESGFAAEADAIISLDQGNRRFGQTVANAGDVNGDGFDDLLVSAPDYLLEGDVRSAVFLFLGSETGLSATDDWRMVGGYSLQLFGDGQVSSAGDVNGDGYDDILVGADYANVEGTRLFLGSANGPALVPDWTLSGYVSYGSQVAAAGDVNQDGFDDLIIGDPGYDGFEGDSGTAYLFLGNADGMPEASSRVEGFRPEGYVSVGLYFATGVSSAGDVNGDGADDIVVGQPTSAPGVVFAYHGLPKDAYLRGTVVDASDGVTPVHPVAIDLNDPSTGQSLYGVTNNPDGSYEFPDIEPGEYKVFFNAVDGANAYIDKLHGDEGLCSNGCDFVARGDLFTVELGNNQLDQGLEPGIEITGTVTETGTATPLVGVTVGFYDGGGGQVHVVDTEDAGNYSSGGLPPQSLYVVADGSFVGYLVEIFDNVLCPGGDCISVAGSATQLNPPAGSSATADFDLDPDLPGSISGNITGSDTGLPVEGINLWLFDTDCNFIIGGETDTNGDYSVEAANPGDYYLFAVGNDTLYIEQQSPYMNQQYPGIDMHDTCYPQFNDVTLGEAISVGDGEQVTGKDFVLNPGGTIRGTISDSNGVLAAGTANARLYSLDGVQQYVALNLEPDGSYRFGGIMPGTWHVVLSSGNQGLIDERYDDVPCPRNSCDSALGMEVTITAGGEITGVDAVLDSGATVSGTMTDADSGQSVEGACANFYTAEGVYVTIGCTDASGNYTTVTGLPPGDYRMSNQLKTHVYFGTDAGYAPQVWTNDGSYLWCGAECDFLLGDTFTVTGTTPVGNIDLAMLSTATLSGTVVSAADGTTPVSPVEVQLWQGGGFTGLSATTAPDGTYEITGVEPGDYKVLFDAQGDAVTYRDELHDEVECGNGSCPVGFVGNTVTLAPGANILDEDLTPGGGISGVMSSSVTGQPLGAFEGRARLYQLDGTQLTTALTDENGAWSFGGVATGSYYVVSAPRFGNLIDELYDDVYCPRLSCDATAGTEVVVAEGAVTSGIDATLDPGSRITGHFLHQDGSPVPAFTTLYIHTPGGVYAGFANTDENGFYQSGSGFPAGDYHVSQYDNGYLNTSYPNVPCGDPCDPTVGQLVTVDGVNDVSGIDFIAELDDGSVAAIYGTVIADDGGAPIDDVKICAVSKSDPEATDCDVTGLHGTYLIGGLPPLADYAVYTEDVGGQAYFLEVFDGLDCCDTSAATPVDVSGGNAEINFSLAASGLITGQVLDSSNDEPVPNVPIELYDGDCNQLQASATQTSDEEPYLGMYAISGVPDGIWYVYANAEWQGYVSELYPDEKRLYACSAALESGQAIVIDNNNHVSGIDFSLDPAGSISGAVSDSNGILPFNTARIRLYVSGTRKFLTQFGNWNGDATYTIPGLPPGTYDVVLTSRGRSLIGERYDDVLCPSSSCELGLGNPVTVGPAEQVTGIDATLEPGAQVVGIITDADTGQGVPGFCLGIYNAEGIYATFACTDQDGNYGSAVGLPPGEYFAANQIFSNPINGGYLPQAWTENGSFVGCGVPCDPRLGDTFTVTGTADVVVNMAMEKGSSISGNVQAGGSPQDGIDVLLLDDTGIQVETTTTDETGNYLFDGLASGGYYVRTLNDLGYQDLLHDEPVDVVCSPQCNPFSGTLIELATSDNVIGIDFTLSSAAGISGSITDGNTDPLAGVTIEAYNDQASLVAASITGADGGYTIGGLGSGTYFMRTRNQLGFLDRLYGGRPCAADCDERDGSPVVIPVELTDATNIDLQLTTGSVIRGRVMGDDGIEVIPLAGIPVRVYSSSGIQAAIVVTDSNGEYAAEGLGSGDYHVLANAPRDASPLTYVGEDLGGNFCQQSCDPLSTPSVSLSAAQVLDVDFQLQKGQSIKLRVTDSNGDLIYGRLVAHAYDSSGNLVRTARLTTVKKVAVKPGEEPPPPPEFNATLANLAPGEYFVDVAGGNYQAETFDDIPCYVPCDPTLGTRVVVTEAPPAEVLEVSLTASNTISGFVYLAGSDPLSGVPGIIVSLYTDTGLFLRSVTTASDGSYAFEGLTNGDYRLMSGGYNDYVDQVYPAQNCSPNGCDIMNGNLVTLRGGDLNNRNFQISTGGTISGYAKDSTGNAVYGRAYLYSAAGDLVDSVSMQTSGLFIFRGIADGTYYVYVDAQSVQVSSTSCHYHYVSHYDHYHRESHCWTSYRYTSSIDTVYNGVDCPDLSCDVTSGTPVVLGSGGAAAIASDFSQPLGVVAPSTTNIEMVMSGGHLIRGSVRTDQDEPLAGVRVYFFDQAGDPVGSALTDGNGEFDSGSGFPDGTYFAATSRAAVPADEPFDAEDAEAGVGRGLQDEVYGDFACVGPCAPSQASGIGTPIVISGSDETGVDIVLGRAAGIQLEKLTNGIDADTPNGGDAPEIAAGETVNWTFEVTNTGGEQLVNIAVADDQGVTVNCPDDTLVSGASMTCTASGPAMDLSQEPFTGVIGNCAGTPNWRLYQNTATVTAQTNGGTDVDDTDSSHYCNPLPKPEVIFSNGFE